MSQATLAVARQLAAPVAPSEQLLSRDFPDCLDRRKPVEPDTAPSLNGPARRATDWPTQNMLIRQAFKQAERRFTAERLTGFGELMS